MLSEKKNTVSEAICPVTHCMKMIGGKWKPIIIYLIRKGGNRFGVLSRGIEGISKQMLTENLRELERDGVITRTVFAEVPPRVEYAVSAYGQTLMPIIDAMSAWGLADMKKQ
jgi:DNA-binding HxlR family transcriptional regulator